MVFLPAPDRAAKKAPLDRPRIVAAARALLDAVGLDELTMRRVAKHLDTRAASLYRHVRDKDELLNLLADEIAGEVPLIRAKGPWRARLVNMATQARRTLSTLRDAARLLAGTRPMGPNRLAHIEGTLKALCDAGLAPREAAWAAYHFNNYINEFAADEARLAAAVAVTGLDRSALLADARGRFASLPAATFPTIVALAEHLAEDDADALFRFGLDLWLDGLEGQLGR